MSSSARTAVAGFALLACLVMSQARVLHQASVSDYITYNNTFIASSTIVGGAPTTASSAVECTTLCATDESCLYWSWCPSSQTSGCVVPGVLGADTTVPASGCVLSYDEMAERDSYFTMSGTAVPFTAGEYRATNQVPAGAATTTADPSNPASWIDPSGKPVECSGFFTDQWAGDEIECHLCNNEYQLKCDLDTDLIGDDSVKCEFDAAGLGALTSNAVEFDCVVDNSKTPQNQCDWEGISARLPTCAVEPVRRIMATWRPDE